MDNMIKKVIMRYKVFYEVELNLDISSIPEKVLAKKRKEK